ncbi:MAG: MIP/aquaporin family protein [Myxococcota bacterium]
MPRRLFAEALGTGALVCGVVGSGIMAARLTDDIALALLANTIATGTLLVVLITVLAPVSGAHFNPAVTLAFALRRQIAPAEAGLFVLAQTIGGISGTALAHAMFERPILQLGTTARSGTGLWIAETVATYGLVLTVFLGIRFRNSAVPWLVGLYITSAYWFTASTSFANPSVAIARAFSDSFAGILPSHVPAFVVAQIVGALLAVASLPALTSSGESP